MEKRPVVLMILDGYGLNDNYYLELNYDYSTAGDYITNSGTYYLSDKAANDILGISE